MHDWALDKGLQFKRSDGRLFTTQLVFIDSGDGMYVDAVYNFTERWQNCMASKGFSALSKRKAEKGDEAGPHNFLRYRIAKSDRSGSVNFIEVSTNYYKTHLYNNLKIERRDFEPQRPGFCNFPRDRGEKFFKMLTAEEKNRDGSFHAGGRRNEALDTRVLNQCAADMFLDSKVAAMRLAAKAKGASDVELQGINHRFVLDLLTRQTARLV
jgi:phage terminase large subunit GpA-like protein